MDQSASLLCRAGHALLLDCRDGETEHVPFDLAGATASRCSSVDTRVRARAASTAQYAEHAATTCEQRPRRLGVEHAARDRGRPAADVDVGAGRRSTTPSDEVLRRRARHVVTEIDRVRGAVERCCDAGDLVEVGRLFDASHASLRDDYEVSCGELDVSVEAARSAGALGARMTGGGFGGSSIALVPADAVEATTREIAEAFAERGWHEPVSFAVTAGAAARRDA